MRRDLAFFYPLPQEQVFNAFVQAANQRFGKDCRLEPPKKLTFGLNYSFKYNMNGGSVTAHFMPYQNGTAIDLRYSVAQLLGARYQKHAQDLTTFTDAILGMKVQPIRLDINVFLAYEQGETPGLPAQEAPQITPQQPAPSPSVPRCGACGREALPGAKFCAGCGQPLAQKLFCTFCGTQLSAGARFCTSCGKEQKN